MQLKPVTFSKSALREGDLEGRKYVMVCLFLYAELSWLRIATFQP